MPVFRHRSLTTIPCPDRRNAGHCKFFKYAVFPCCHYGVLYRAARGEAQKFFALWRSARAAGGAVGRPAVPPEALVNVFFRR